MNDWKPTLSDEAVKAKTGKDWGEWFAILDAAGAKQLTHKQIVAFLVKEYQVEPWWQQMVTVTYEQVRGLRDKHEIFRLPDQQLENLHSASRYSLRCLGRLSAAVRLVA